jgi:hypothetical protein
MTLFDVSDSQHPDRKLLLELNPADWYDEDQPGVNEEEAEEFLAWWVEPQGRGYLVTEDGGYIVLAQVHATSAEPIIELWLQSDNDERWNLEDFPFPNVSFTEVER